MFSLSEAALIWDVRNQLAKSSKKKGGLGVPESLTLGALVDAIAHLDSGGPRRDSAEGFVDLVGRDLEGVVKVSDVLLRNYVHEEEEKNDLKQLTGNLERLFTDGPGPFVTRDECGGPHDDCSLCRGYGKCPVGRGPVQAGNEGPSEILPEGLFQPRSRPDDSAVRVPGPEQQDASLPKEGLYGSASVPSGHQPPDDCPW